MFERFALPTPFQVGPVNSYVAGRTVVDPGPDGEDALAALEAGLASRDLALEDVEQVLVTHAHPDHFGLAKHLREHGAAVLASPITAAIMRDFEGRLDFEQAYFTALFEAHGMAPETTQTVTQLPEAFVEFAPSVETDRELEGGDTVEVDGGEVAIRELVGHSESELIVEWGDGAGGTEGVGESERGGDGDFSALVGDHVLPDTTPNPFLQPPKVDVGTVDGFEGHDPADLDELRPHQLLAFNESLRELRAVGHDRLFPGHGEAIEAPAARIDEILDSHEERSADVLELLDGPTTAVEVMRGLFEDLPVIDYFPGMSEALGHLDVLVDRGDAVRAVEDGTLVYRRA